MRLEKFRKRTGLDSDPKDARCSWCGKSDAHPNGTVSVRVLTGLSFCSVCLPSAVLRYSNKGLSIALEDGQWGELPQSQ